MDQITRLTLRGEVEDLVARYAHTADDFDDAGFAACFAEDCVVEHPGMPPVRGREAILRIGAAFRPRLESIHHLQTNVLVTLLSQASAGIRWDTHAVVTFKTANGPVRCSSGARYEATAVRTDLGWRFTRMVIADRWADERIHELMGAGGPPPMQSAGGVP